MRKVRGGAARNNAHTPSAAWPDCGEGRRPGSTLSTLQSLPCAGCLGPYVPALTHRLAPASHLLASLPPSLLPWFGCYFADVAEGGDLPTDYQYTWAQESYSKRQRTLDTWSFVLTLRSRLWLLDQAWSYPGGLTPEKKAERGRVLAVWIRERILQLGPTFIKLGQVRAQLVGVALGGSGSGRLYVLCCGAGSNAGACACACASLSWRGLCAAGWRAARLSRAAQAAHRCLHSMPPFTCSSASPCTGAPAPPPPPPAPAAALLHPQRFVPR